MAGSGLRRELVGRGEELAAIDAFFASEGAGASALVLDGEPGIGKTTVWEEVVRHARSAGARVLVARPAEREASLPHAALADLVEPLVAAGLELPGALQAVLDGETASGLAVCRAMLGLVRASALDAPIVLAVDDAQWLDQASEAVVAFVVRRIGDLPVRVVVARRSTEAEPPPLGLERALGERLLVQRIGPLSLTDLDRLLGQRLGAGLPRPRLVRLHRACGGNPLYALEIARSLIGAEGDDDALPLPPGLASVLRARIQALPLAAADAALLTSACLQPTVRLVERAAGGSAGLADAVSLDVLRVERDRLRFTHPLLAEATYSAAAPWERRDAHARLAAVADSSLERAHHLASSVERPDGEVADELERAAAEAAGRGVPATAVDLAEHSARLSPDDESRVRRSIAAAEYRVVAGDPEGGRVALEELADGLPAGGTRARVLASVADLIGSAEPERALELQRQALDEAHEEPALGAEIHLGLATTAWTVGQVVRSTEHVRRAVELAEAAGDDVLTAMALGELLHCEMMLGLPFSEPTAARALELERSLEHLPAATYARPTISLAIVYTAIDRPDDARRLLAAELARIDAAGDEAIRWGVLARLAELELRVGNLAEAVRLGREALEAARLLDHSGIERYALLPYAAALAHVGQIDQAREVATDALAQSERSTSRLTALRALGTLGFSALSEGQPDEARATLGPAVEELREIGAGELSIFGVAENAIEAAAALGRLDEAEALIVWVEECGRPGERAWHRAIAARGRGLVAAARGEHEAARAALEEALAAHSDLPQPFERARTLLARGQIERRAKRRAPARAALTQALELFDALGAARWAEKAAAELARIPGRARGSAELSETERRVAELVAQGLSNKEVAAKLFVTVRTVEANLSKVYAKLGVRSRTELVSRLHDGRRQNHVGFHD